MAENESGAEKTEAPTGKRRQEAFDDGNIARSTELTSALILLGSIIVLQSAGPGLRQYLADNLGATLSSLDAVAADPQVALLTMRDMGYRTLQALSYTIGALAMLSLAIGAAQARGVLTLKPLEPKFSKLNPVKGFTRLFSKKGLIELPKSLIKMLVVGLAIWSVLRHAIPDFGTLVQQEPTAIFRVLGTYGVRILVTSGFAFLALGIADFLYQRWQFEEGLKMTKDEVKQESKSQEGDQNIKARRRSIGRDRVRKAMFANVKTANVVLVNPTHIAIALRYDPSVAPAPVVVAMGQRKIAERIKQLALESGVPIVENKPLARAMIKVCQVGMMIPADMYAAVAEVLAFVYRRRNAHASGWAGSATV